MFTAATKTTDNDNDDGAKKKSSNGGVYSEQLVKQYAQPDKTTDDTNPPEVTVFLAINNRGHQYSELPQVLNAMKSLEKDEISRKLIVIKDPVRDDKYDNWIKKRDTSDDYDSWAAKSSLGALAASRVFTWYEDDELKPGQIKVDDNTFTLLDPEGFWSKDDPSTEAYQEGGFETSGPQEWQRALVALGIPDEKAEVISKMLFFYNNETIPGLATRPEHTHRTPQVAGGSGAAFSDLEGSYWSNEADAQGTNELLQLVMTLYRAEIGEFTIKNLIISGHHTGGQNSEDIYGAMDGANEDRDDNFDTRILYSLSRAFPKAFSQIESVSFAACSTHKVKDPYQIGEGIVGGEDFGDLRMQKYDVEKKEFLSEQADVFPNLRALSYWVGTCPAATSSQGHKTLGSIFHTTNQYTEKSKRQFNEQDTDKIYFTRTGDKTAYNHLHLYNTTESFSKYKKKSYSGLEIDKTPYYEYDNLKEFIYQGVGPISDSIDTKALENFNKQLPAAEERTEEEAEYFKTIEQELAKRNVSPGLILWHIRNQVANEENEALVGQIDELLSQPELSMSMLNTVMQEYKKFVEIDETSSGTALDAATILALTGLEMVDGINSLQKSEQTSLNLRALNGIKSILGSEAQGSYQASLYEDEAQQLVENASAATADSDITIDSSREGNKINVDVKLSGNVISSYKLYLTPASDQLPETKSETSGLRTTLTGYYALEGSTPEGIATSSMTNYSQVPAGSEQLLRANNQSWSATQLSLNGDQYTLLPDANASEFSNHWNELLNQNSTPNRYYGYSVVVDYFSEAEGFPQNIALNNMQMLRYDHSTNKWVATTAAVQRSTIVAPQAIEFGKGSLINNKFDFATLQLLNLQNYEALKSATHGKKSEKFQPGTLKKLLSLDYNQLQQNERFKNISAEDHTKLQEALKNKLIGRNNRDL